MHRMLLGPGTWHSVLISSIPLVYLCVPCVRLGLQRHSECTGSSARSPDSGEPLQFSSLLWCHLHGARWVLMHVLSHCRGKWHLMSRNWIMTSPTALGWSSIWRQERWKTVSLCLANFLWKDQPCPEITVRGLMSINIYVIKILGCSSPWTSELQNLLLEVTVKTFFRGVGVARAVKGLKQHLLTDLCPGIICHSSWRHINILTCQTKSGLSSTLWKAKHGFCCCESAVTTPVQSGSV